MHRITRTKQAWCDAQPRAKNHVWAQKERAEATVAPWAPYLLYERGGGAHGRAVRAKVARGGAHGRAVGARRAC